MMRRRPGIPRQRGKRCFTKDELIAGETPAVRVEQRPHQRNKICEERRCVLALREVARRRDVPTICEGMAPRQAARPNPGDYVVHLSSNDDSIRASDGKEEGVAVQVDVVQEGHVTDKEVEEEDDEEEQEE